MLEPELVSLPRLLMLAFATPGVSPSLWETRKILQAWIVDVLPLRPMAVEQLEWFFVAVGPSVFRCCESVGEDSIHQCCHDFACGSTDEFLC